MKTTFNTPIGKISCYNNDHYFYQSLSTGNPYEFKMINDYLKSFILNSKNILDIGSHIGYHAIAYSRINPNIDIIAFEPQKMVYDLLCENIQLNGLSTIMPLNLAVSNKLGVFSLSKTISDGKNTAIPIEYGTEKEFNLGGVCLGKDGEQINTTTIDSWGFKNIDFIKIDVEGAESLVIMGGIETIKKFKPVVCYESNAKTITPDMAEMFGCENIKTPRQLLEEIGYSIFINISNDNVIAIYS